MLECLIPPSFYPKYSTQAIDINIVIKIIGDICPSLDKHRRMTQLCDDGLNQREAPRNLARRLDNIHTILTEWATANYLCTNCRNMMKSHRSLTLLCRNLAQVRDSVRNQPETLEEGFSQLEQTKVISNRLRRAVQRCEQSQIPQQPLLNGPQIATQQVPVIVDLTTQPIANIQQVIVPPAQIATQHIEVVNLIQSQDLSP